VIVMAAMHQVHERTSQQDEIGRYERNMRQMKDKQIYACRRGSEAGDQSWRRS
jgi:hypothetical protein